MTSIRSKAVRLLAAGAIVTGASLLPAAAFAQDVGTYGGGNDNNGDGMSDTGSNDPSSTESGGGSLPFTGGDVVGLALIGAGAVGGGAILVRSGRRRTAARA